MYNTLNQRGGENGKLYRVIGPGPVPGPVLVLVLVTGLVLVPVLVLVLVLVLFWSCSWSRSWSRSCPGSGPGPGPGSGPCPILVLIQAGRQVSKKKIKRKNVFLKLESFVKHLSGVPRTEIQCLK